MFRVLCLAAVVAFPVLAADGKSGLVYKQSTGEMFFDGKLVAKGYSGQPTAKNDGSKEKVKATGPIPVGRYTLGSPRTYKAMKDCVDLTPDGHDAHGRTEFMIHGDSKAKPGTASMGCIILDPAERKALLATKSKTLEVVP